MTRRKNKTITSPGGWSNVVGKGRAPLRIPSALTKFANLSLQDEDVDTSTTEEEKELVESRIAVINQRLTENTIELVQSSELLKNIKERLENVKKLDVGNVVILGLGSLDGESSLFQFAFVEEVRRSLDLLSKPCYIQDPAFKKFDIRLFQERNMEVFESPGANKFIGDKTFLFAPHLEYDILQEALERRPAVVFCNDLQNFLDTKLGNTTLYPEFQHYIENFFSFVVQGVDHHDSIGNGRAFNHSALYWKKDISEGDVLKIS